MASPPKSAKDFPPGATLMDVEPGMSAPSVGAQVAYCASQATNPQPATLAQDLGAGRYNIQVIGADGVAYSRANVLYVSPWETLPASGEYCRMPLPK
jgi:hypothetical protein